MEYILNAESAIVVHELIKSIQENKDYLSQVDGAIGDGDHGVNMNKGFTLCKEKLGERKVSLSEALNVLGRTLLMEIGGSMGPLYGTFFIEMAKACREKNRIDKYVFQDMMERALKGLQTITNAKVGDKTLMDTLVPAVEAYSKAISEGKSFKEALIEMKNAAEKGKESTKDMIAKMGRASRLGERSRGVLDAGATSCYIIISSIVDSIINLID